MKSKTLLFNFHFRKIFSKIALLLFFTFFNASAIQAQVGSALDFDGANDKVVVGNAMNAILDPLNKITVEAWVKPSNTTFNGVIVGNYFNSNNEMQFLLRRDFDQFALWVNDGTGYKVVNSGVGTVALNTWQHVAGVWDGSSLYIYIDGVLKATTTGVTGSGFPTSTNLVVIGSNSYPESFAGSIDELRIWTRPLSQCEIQNNRNGELPSGQTDLLAYYQFNQGTADGNNAGMTSLTDSSGNNYNGTLTNFVLNGATSNWISPGGVTNGTVSPAFSSLSVATTQSLCSSATVADLTATGTSLQWYDVDSGGTALFATTVLASGTYYVTQTTGTCESPRTAVTVTINPIPVAPTATSPQMVNTGTTVANLFATGTDLKWYADATGGASLVNTTPLTSGLYYVSQTISGCESPRTAVQVNTNGAALDFDGANDYVSCGNIMPATYTKEAWFYVSNLGLQNNLISGGNDGQHALYPSMNFGNRISAGHNGIWNSVQDPTPIVANTWYHVALTYDAATTTMKLYTNGVLVSTNPSVAPFVGGNALRIGAFDNVQNLLGGKMDEVRIWSRALPQAEIQNNMNCELGSDQTGLVAHYQFNQGIDSENNSAMTTLTDSSGNTNTGTLNGFALTGTTSNWTAAGAVTTGNTCSAFLSVNDVEFSSKVKVYPNPSNEVFYIDTDSRSEIVVFDLVGKIIRTMHVNSGTSKLEVSNFPSGMYLMKVTNENNQTKTIKLIKE